MSKRIFVSLLLVVSCALLLAACGKTETSNNASTTNNSTTGTTKTSSTPATTTPASGEKVGIAECDDFLEKYDACVSGKIPEAVRAQYKSSIEQWRKSWRELAAKPETKGTLASICKSTIEQSRASMKSFGCEF